MSFDDHESCRRCGSRDSRHTLADCESRRKAALAPAVGSIPTPAELRAKRDAAIAAEFDRAIQSIVGALSATSSLSVRQVVSTRSLGDAVAMKMREAGWLATVETVSGHRNGDGNGYVVAVSAPEVPA